jgi:hypothetical protein
VPQCRGSLGSVPPKHSMVLQNGGVVWDSGVAMALAEHELRPCPPLMDQPSSQLWVGEAWI